MNMFSPSEFDRKRLRLVFQREQEAGENLQSYAAAHAMGTKGISIEIAPTGDAEAPVNQGVDCYHVKIFANSTFGGAGPVPDEPISISTISARDSMLENRSRFASAVFAEPEDGPLHRQGEKGDSEHNEEPMPADITLATPRVPKLTVPNLREAWAVWAAPTSQSVYVCKKDFHGLSERASGLCFCFVTTGMQQEAFGCFWYIYIYVCVNIYIYLLYYITRASTKRVNIEYIRIRVY